MKKQHLILTEAEIKHIESLLSKGDLNTRVYKRAFALKKLHSGMTYQAVADLLEVSYASVHGWAKKYRSEGLNFLLDKPRSGRPTEYNWEDRSKVTALACSAPPEGYQRWSIRLLADRLVALELIPKISPSGVQRILKKTNFSLIENAIGASEK